MNHFRPSMELVRAAARHAHSRLDTVPGVVRKPWKRTDWNRAQANLSEAIEGFLATVAGLAYLDGSSWTKPIAVTDDNGRLKEQYQKTLVECLGLSDSRSAHEVSREIVSQFTEWLGGSVPFVRGWGEASAPAGRLNLYCSYPAEDRSLRWREATATA